MYAASKLPFIMQPKSQLFEAFLPETNNRREKASNLTNGKYTVLSYYYLIDITIFDAFI